MGFEVDDNNEPAPENVPAGDAPPVNGGALLEGQEWGGMACAHKRALCLFRVPSGYRLHLKLQMLLIVFVSSGMSHRLVRVQWSLLS